MACVRRVNCAFPPPTPFKAYNDAAWENILHQQPQLKLQDQHPISLQEVTATSLLGLPGELQNAIFEHLDYISAFSLSMSCTYLHRTVDPSGIPDQVKEQDLLYMEIAPRQLRGKKFACFTCWKINTIDAFHSGQTSERRAKFRPDAHLRYCRDCGPEGKQYPTSPPPALARYSPFERRWICSGCGSTLKLTDARHCKGCLRVVEFDLPPTHTLRVRTVYRSPSCGARDDMREAVEEGKRRWSLERIGP